MSVIGAQKVATRTANGIPSTLMPITLPGLVLIVLLAWWELGVRRFEVPSYVLPSPTAIFGAFVENYPVILGELWTTFLTFAIAYSLTIVIGYVFAALMFEWHVLETIFYPYVITARAIPIVALIPIFIIWFGFGFRSIVIISFLIGLFAMVVNSLAGFKSVDPSTVEMLRSFSANRRELFREVYFYGSLPLVLAGAKICVILTFTGVLVGEFFIGTEGIGFLILEYNNALATASMFASIVAVSGTQLALFGAVVLAERRIVNWR